MIDNELVTIVIPTYKRPSALERAISSALGQSYPHIEIIIVDDNGIGTPAQVETSEIVKKYKSKVTYICHEFNKGGSAARNTGLRSAKGFYINFLDDDDEICPDKIEKQVKRLKETAGFGSCYTAYKLIKPNGNIIKSKVGREGDVFVQALARTFYVGSGSNLLICTDLVRGIGGYDESFIRNQDIEFMTRLFKVSKVAYVDECLLTIHQDGVRKKRSAKEVDDIAKFYLFKFEDEINLLEARDKNHVLNIINLERARSALSSGDKGLAKLIIKERKIPFWVKISFFAYLVKRVTFKTSFGFYY